ncbi:villin-like protein quail isoform X2 [Drosophila navojoa]|uniref:villin-like protein quail isoform X2 n=1 Tax=Drosophila navojoa TaxID=7232 RepID=UPI0011BFA68B|nr:villin-like protein quail isoform X2 [Drosophila navojoa]
MELTKETEVRPDSIPDLKVDATFRKVPKNAISFAIWKIDEDRLEAVARPQYGTFYDNCAYIIYAANLVGHYASHETITREQKPNVPLERYIHYWLGSQVSEQNRSNVVHKIQELDTYLGNVASIYRESQHHESARFLSYFKNGYDVLSGSLLNAPKQTRLFQLYGRKWLRAIELANVDWAHFNSDYIMVLLMDAMTFVWIGRSSAGIERRSALAWVQRQQRKDVPLCVVDDGYEQSMSAEQKELWNKVLPLQHRMVYQARQSGGDYDSSNCCGNGINGINGLNGYNGSGKSDANANKFRIYKCNQRGRLHLDQLDVGMPSKDDLSDANGVYLLDNFGQSIWLWVGAQATQADALTAMGNGRAFVKKKKYPNTTLVVRVLEGREPVEFKRLFGNWLSVWQDNTRGHKPVSTKFGKLDAVLLGERPKMAADTQLVDDGRGERIIYRICGDEMEQLPPAKATVFTTNASYVVNYTVQCATVVPADLASVGIKSIIYQWNGSEASAETIAKADSYAMASFESLKEPGMFVQLYEFDETPHFLQMFEGKLIIMRGQRSELLHSNNNLNWDFKTNIMLETFLLKIYGDASYNAKAVEEHPLSSISSKDCYAIKTNHVWVWCGQSSTGDAREMAKAVGALLGESSLVLEGKESKEFWQSVAMYFNQSLVINGQSCSSSTTSSSSSSGAGSMCNGSNNSNGNGTGNISPTLSNNCYLNTTMPSKPRPPVQLFLVWWEQRHLRCEEILGFEQRDLSADCTYILDTGTLAYVWLGEHAVSQERERYTTVAQSYVQNAPFGRRAATALAVVRQHAEPNVFKGFFETWDNELGKGFVTYEQMRQQLATIAPSNGLKEGSALILNNNQKDFDGHKKYPLPVLVQEMDMLPPEINPLRREVHLTHDDFVSVFKMSFYEFDELPKWKKQELKKLYKLF